jgi:hypothetical protein
MKHRFLIVKLVGRPALLGAPHNNVSGLPPHCHGGYPGEGSAEDPATAQW